MPEAVPVLEFELVPLVEFVVLLCIVPVFELEFELRSDVVDEFAGIALELFVVDVPVLLLVVLLFCATATPAARPMAPIATAVNFRIAFM